MHFSRYFLRLKTCRKHADADSKNVPMGLTLLSCGCTNSIARFKKPESLPGDSPSITDRG
jgi:hypothetical protein